MKRIGYDADTGKYLFRDKDGCEWEGGEGAQFGEMRRGTYILLSGLMVLTYLTLWTKSQKVVQPLTIVTKMTWRMALYVQMDMRRYREMLCVPFDILMPTELIFLLAVG